MAGSKGWRRLWLLTSGLYALGVATFASWAARDVAYNAWSRDSSALYDRTQLRLQRELQDAAAQQQFDPNAKSVWTERGLASVRELEDESKRHRERMSPADRELEDIAVANTRSMTATLAAASAMKDDVQFQSESRALDQQYWTEIRRQIGGSLGFLVLLWAVPLVAAYAGGLVIGRSVHWLAEGFRDETR